MAIVGFTFDKITAEKRGPIRGRVDINNNVGIKSIETTNLPFGKEKQEALKFNYQYTSSYQPDIGVIDLTGSLIFIDEPKKVKEILQNWEKNKRLPAEVMKDIMENVLNRCNIQALVLSREVSLPSPIPLPKVAMQTTTTGTPAKGESTAPQTAKK